MTALIKARHVAFSYGQHPVLTDVTFTVQPGEIIGLIGENGAGKTTLLNLLLGTLPLPSGQLQLFGHGPGDSAVKAHLGAMLQGDVVLPNVTVGEYLQLAAAQFAQSLEPQRLLSDLQLTALKHRALNGLSGGQLRRVTFAVALIGNPDLLFLDEPTVGMDTNAQRAFWQRMRALRDQGKTVVITSHYLPTIQDVADRILLLQGGRLVFQGPFEALQQRYQRVVITCQTPLPVTPFGRLAGVVTATKQAAGLQLITTDGDRTLQALVPYLKDLHQLTVHRESLADIFVQLTGGRAK
ncbi:ABC transporter ATP-binding protein [Lactiplantibacillus garii]|uniref:ABC transporter ATP-binding protein n=1 Tax=Lactiplantibacillus garii TaxID=2306423 RepID=A0A426D502_9LACO|nr:ABC transporter ATP-binding protein [Lactiplantibacillus garii]RRK09735.1 ABC transporter ATP-binding protein [Lactiplantibacillus garii]